MPSRARSIVGGFAYHALQRANRRLRLFKKRADYAAFEQTLSAAHERAPFRILAYALIGNHGRFVVWPKHGKNSEAPEFFRWLTLIHSRRWHAHRGTRTKTRASGHVGRGRVS